MTPDRQIHGFAIVSDDGCIADASGATPQALRNEADWAYFQGWLDRAALTVLGREGHLAHPNEKRRKRLVLSSSAKGIEERADGLWWNPAHVPVADALRIAAPAGGIVAVPGGQRVFDLFLAFGYDAFHLSRAHGVTQPGGVKLFSGLDGETAEGRLVRHGLVPGATRMLDPANRVSLTVFRRDRSTGGRG